MRFVDDAELASEISQAELVVLPYRELHNSGSVLLALSLGRPVLLPANDVTRRLAEQVGERWVLPYEGTLTGDVLESALATVRDASTDSAAHPGAGVAADGSSTQVPNLSDRAWDRVAAMHVAAYRLATHKVLP